MHERFSTTSWVASQPKRLESLLAIHEPGSQLDFNGSAGRNDWCSPSKDRILESGARNARERFDGHDVTAAVPGIAKGATQLLPKPEVLENLDRPGQSSAEVVSTTRDRVPACLQIAQIPKLWAPAKKSTMGTESLAANLDDEGIRQAGRK